MSASGSKERVPFRAAEQIANLSGHYAVELIKENPKKRADFEPEWEPEYLLGKAREILDTLLQLEATPERYGLLGSHFKRCAHTHKGKQRETDLTSAVEKYRQAIAANPRAGERPNFVTNAAFCRIAQKAPFDQKEAEELTAEIEKTVSAATIERASESSFWNRIYAADGALAKRLILLLTSVDTETKVASEEIVAAYQMTFALGGTPREHNSVLQTHHFLADLLENHHPIGAKFVRDVLAGVEAEEAND